MSAVHCLLFHIEGDEFSYISQEVRLHSFSIDERLFSSYARILRFPKLAALIVSIELIY